MQPAITAAELARELVLSQSESDDSQRRANVGVQVDQAVDGLERAAASAPDDAHRALCTRCARACEASPSRSRPITSCVPVARPRPGRSWPRPMRPGATAPPSYRLHSTTSRLRSLRRNSSSPGRWPAPRGWLRLAWGFERRVRGPGPSLGVTEQGSAAGRRLRLFRPGALGSTRYRTLGMATIRVALAEDNALLREGISRIIDARHDLELVGGVPTCPSSSSSSRTRPMSSSPISACRPPGPTRGSRPHRGSGSTGPRWGGGAQPVHAPAYALALLETGSAGRAYLLKERVAGPTSWPRPSAPWPRAAP